VEVSPAKRVAAKRAAAKRTAAKRTAANRTAVKRSTVKPAAAPDTARQPMRRTIRGGRPYFFADPAIDKVLNMVIVLGSEVWTLRERLAAMEAIQVRQGGLAAGEVDAHEFAAEDEAQLGAQRKEFIDSLFRVLQEQVEEARGRSTRAKSR
jgi:hypothetical protein